MNEEVENKWDLPMVCRITSFVQDRRKHVAHRGVRAPPPAPPESNVEGEKLQWRWCEILSIWQDPLLASTLHPGGRGGRSVFSAAGKVPPPSVQVVRHTVHPRSLSAGAEPLLLLGLHIGVGPPLAGPSFLKSWAIRPCFTILSPWYGY